MLIVRVELSLPMLRSLLIGLSASSIFIAPLSAQVESYSDYEKRVPVCTEEQLNSKKFRRGGLYGSIIGIECRQPAWKPSQEFIDNLPVPGR